MTTSAFFSYFYLLAHSLTHSLTRPLLLVATTRYEHELALAKAALQDGSFGRRRWPVQVVAGCIKLFYRTLPKRLLKHLPRELLQDGRVLASSRFANAAVDGMPDPHRSLLQVRARARAREAAARWMIDVALAA